MSGPVVLPCSAQAKKAIEASLVAASRAHDETALMHRAMYVGSFISDDVFTLEQYASENRIPAKVSCKAVRPSKQLAKTRR